MLKASFQVQQVTGGSMPGATLKPVEGVAAPFTFMAAQNGTVLVFLASEKERALFEQDAQYEVTITKLSKGDDHGSGI